MEKIYCWIKDNKMFMASKSPPSLDWCDSYIETEVDNSRSYIFEYNSESNQVTVKYIN